MDVSFSWVCPVLENEFRHNIVKKGLQIHSAIISWIHSYFDKVMVKFMINNRKDAWKTDDNLLHKESLNQSDCWKLFVKLWNYTNAWYNLWLQQLFLLSPTISNLGQELLSLRCCMSQLHYVLQKRVE